jgi:hypothetical protein
MGDNPQFGGRSLVLSRSPQLFLVVGFPIVGVVVWDDSHASFFCILLFFSHSIEGLMLS